LQQGTLAARVKQTLILKSLLDLQKLLEQRALPGARHGFHDQLQFAPGRSSLRRYQYHDKFW
jgi:hypothetical protein